MPPSPLVHNTSHPSSHPLSNRLPNPQIYLPFLLSALYAPAHDLVLSQLYLSYISVSMHLRSPVHAPTIPHPSPTSPLTHPFSVCLLAWPQPPPLFLLSNLLPPHPRSDEISAISQLYLSAMSLFTQPHVPCHKASTNTAQVAKNICPSALFCLDIIGQLLCLCHYCVII